MRGRDLIAAEQLLQRLRIAVRLGRRHHQLRADDQRPEKFPHRDIEAAWGFLQHHILRAERIVILHPEQAVNDRLVAHQHAFRSPGRT